MSSLGSTPKAPNSPREVNQMQLNSESPGTRGTAARAWDEIALQGTLSPEYRAAQFRSATHFWDRDANAIAPICELRAVLP